MRRSQFIPFEVDGGSKEGTMRMHRPGLAALVALCVALPVRAQEHERHPTGSQEADLADLHCSAGMGAMMHGNMPGQRGGRAGMQAGAMMQDMMGPPTPAMILQHKEKLGLSASQVTRLEGLQKEGAATCKQHMQLAMTAHRAANQLLEPAAPDFGAYSAKLKEATAHMVEAHVAMAKSAVAAREVLTTAQRQTLKTLMEQMHKKP